MAPICPPPWHFTTWLDLDLLDHWQSLVAGLVALVAAIIALGGTELFARLKERRERKAIRLSLAEEIQWLLRHLLVIHSGLKQLSAELKHRSAGLSARDVQDFTSLREPVIYPAIADKIGFIRKLAPYVVAFYGNIQHIPSAVRITANDPAKILSSTDLDQIAKLFEQACRENALPLLSRLPRDKANADLKKEIEAMGRTPAGG